MLRWLGVSVLCLGWEGRAEGMVGGALVVGEAVGYLRKGGVAWEDRHVRSIPSRSRDGGQRYTSRPDGAFVDHVA